MLGPRLNFPGYMADITPIIYWCYTRSHTRPVLSTIYPGLHPIYQYYTPLNNKYCYPNSKEILLRLFLQCWEFIIIIIIIIIIKKF